MKEVVREGSSILSSEQNDHTYQSREGDLIMDRNSKNRRVFVNHLSEHTTEADLEYFFAQYGVVTAIQLKRDRITGASWQHAYIEMESVLDVQTAIRSGNDQILDDRQIRVLHVRH